MQSTDLMEYLLYRGMMLLMLVLGTTCEPVLENVYVSTFTASDGHKTLLYYTEINKIVNEEILLECSLPIATWWEWRIHGKVGSPYAKNMILGYDKPIHKQWERHIDHATYPWDVLIVSCTPMKKLKRLITKIWVINKLSSSSDTPLHPMSCMHPAHQCHPRVADCYYGNGAEYHGASQFSKSGACQPWDSIFPNSQTSTFLTKYAQTLDYWGNHNYCRNPGGEREKPFCVTSADRRSLGNAAIEGCYVPKCDDCAYGVGGSGEVSDLVGIGMQFYGVGYCSSGYYAGWDGGISSIEECHLVCLKDPQCKFVAYYHAESCSRYKEETCTIKNGATDPSYLKYKIYSKVTLGMMMHYHGIGTCSKGFYDGGITSSRAECFKLCAKEPKCSFVAYEDGKKSCNRYSWPNCPEHYLSNDDEREYKIYRKVSYPKYQGSQLTTVNVVKTAKGNVPRQCYIPNEKWKDNMCQWKKRTILGRSIEQSKQCRCLVRTKTTTDGTIDDPFDDQIELVDCLLRQCLVRQVYFLMISPNGYIFHLHDNEEFIEIDVWLNSSPDVFFLPVGIVDVTELKVVSDNKLQARLPFKVMTVGIPALSKLKFDNVQMDAQGKYFFEYTFGIANKIVQDNMYRGNFKIVVMTPTKIELKSSDACPGMNTKVSLEVKGSVAIETSSIIWEISYDEVEWTSADLMIDDVDMSADSFHIMLKNVKKATYVRVRARSGIEDLNASTKIGVKTSPKLIINEQNIEVIEGKDAQLMIEYESSATTKWIYNFKVIDKDDPGSHISFINQLADQDNMNQQVLQITSYNDRYSGIYTVEVERDQCVTTDSIYLSSM